MNPNNRNQLRVRVVAAAEGVLARQGFVSAIDVLLGMGWLDQATLKRWKQSQLAYLEAGIHRNLSRISEAMRLFRAWATEKHLSPSETAYVAKTPARTTLRFSKSGDATIERLYRTHWVSRDLSAKKRERIQEAQSRPTELVVIQPIDAGWKCHRCGGSGDLVIMEEPGLSCLTCAGLGALVFLPAGDAGRSRRAKASSNVYAVVVRFSRTRKRYERQGLLVQPEALRDADGSRALREPPDLA